MVTDCRITGGWIPPHISLSPPLTCSTSPTTVTPTHSPTHIFHLNYHCHPHSHIPPHLPLSPPLTHLPLPPPPTHSSEADSGTDTSGAMGVDITNKFDEHEVLPDMVVPWMIIAVVLGVWVIYACIYVGMEVRGG